MNIGTRACTRLAFVRLLVARGRSNDLPFRLEGWESDHGGGRRPKTKYEIGRAPAELMIATAAAHTRFWPRIWLAGRRLMSTSAATRRALSATAALMSSRRVRSLRSLHCRLGMTSSA